MSSRPSAYSQANIHATAVCSSSKIASPARLPDDTLIEVFQRLRQEAMFLPVASFDQPHPDGMVCDLVAPPLSITGVCKNWRNIAIKTPQLWSSIPLLLENFGSLCLRNPCQVAYHLARTSRSSPLKLIIGSRGQLIGPGVKAEYPTAPARFDTLQKLAPQVVELRLAFDQRDDSSPELFSPQHDFAILQKLWLQGITDRSTQLIHGAGFWRSPHLRGVTWAVSTLGYPPPLGSRPWLNLTELAIHEYWQVVLQAESVRVFLMAATSLVKLDVQVCECIADSNHSPSSHGGRQSFDLKSTSTFTSHTAPPRILIHHHRLQHLGVTFHGASLEDTPALLQGLELPNLRSFDFGADYAANFNPTTVVAWVGSGCHILRRLECSVDLVNMADLIEALREMPLLEVLKCVGSMVGCYYESHKVASLFSNPSFNPYTDDLFLRELGPADAYDAAIQGIVTPPRSQITSANKPCPILRKLHVTHGYFSADALEAFVQARLYGGASRKEIAGTVKSSATLQQVTVEDLVTMESVYEIRDLVHRLKGEHGVIVHVPSGVYPSYYSERWSV